MKLLSRFEVERKAKPFLQLRLVGGLAYTTYIFFDAIHRMMDHIASSSEVLYWMSLIDVSGLIIAMVVLTVIDILEWIEKHRK